MLVSTAVAQDGVVDDPVGATTADSGGATALPDTTELMAHLDDLYRSDSNTASVRMTVVTEEYERELEMDSWAIGDDLSLIVIRSPSREAGTATLRTEEGLWNYAPRADRLMRIPSGLMSEGWMGSHFTNDDMMRDSEYDDDYTSEISAVEVDGVSYIVARSTPNDATAIVYTRVDFWVTADTWTPVRTEYFDGDELIRTMTYSDVADVGGRTIPTVMTIVPSDAPDEMTRVEYLSIEFDADVDPDLFTQRGLRRVAQQ